MGKNARPEHGLSHWVDRFLERTVVLPGYWTAVETGVMRTGMTEQQYMLTMQRRKARGIKPNHLDFYIYQRPYYAQIELKAGKNKATTGQEATIILLTRHGIPSATCRTVMEVAEFLTGVGFQLSANWRNVAVECDLRNDANRREDAAPAKPKAASKPRAAKPKQSQIKALERIRRGVLF